MTEVAFLCADAPTFDEIVWDVLVVCDACGAAVRVDRGHIGV